MTPEKLQAARAKAEAAGDTEAVQEIDALLAEIGTPAVDGVSAASSREQPAREQYVGARDASGVPFIGARQPNALDAVRPLAEGFSQGAMGEIQGALAGPQGQQTTDARRQAFAQAYPKTAFGLDMLGSASSAMLLPGAGSIPQGAILGGVQGAMRADPGSRALGGLLGAGAGAVLSWAGPKLLGGVSDAALKRIPPAWIDRVRGALGRGGNAEAAYARGVELGQAQAARLLAKTEGPATGSVIATNPAREAPSRLLPSEKVLAAEIKDMGAVDRHALRIGLIKTLGDQLDEAAFSGSTPQMEAARTALLEEMTPVLRAAFKGSRKGGDVIAAFENKIKAFGREPTRTSIQVGKMGGTLGGRAHVPTPSEIRWPHIPLGETPWARGVLGTPPRVPRETGAAVTGLLQQGAGLASPGATGLLTPTFLELLKQRRQGQ